MARINTGRVIAGGLAAGIAMVVFDYLVNGVWLGPRWQAQSEMLHPGLAAAAATTSMVGWILYDLLVGFATVWLYAAIRPRLGPGPRTALYAGFFTWFLTHLAFASYWFGGMFTWRLVAASSAGSLVASLVAAWLGGMLYQEAESEPSQASR